MKLRIEVEDNIAEDEIIIRCKNITPQILQLQEKLQKEQSVFGNFVAYRGETEYYLDFRDILFFQTEAGQIQVHTKSDVYETDFKLYELEKMLPSCFLRISKSTIVNCEKIYSISRNLTAASLVQFQGTHKQAYVSRAYYKTLQNKLKEKRIQYET